MFYLFMIFLVATLSWLVAWPLAWKYSIAWDWCGLVSVFAILCAVVLVGDWAGILSWGKAESMAWLGGLTAGLLMVHLPASRKILWSFRGRKFPLVKE